MVQQPRIQGIIFGRDHKHFEEDNHIWNWMEVLKLQHWYNSKLFNQTVILLWLQVKTNYVTPIKLLAVTWPTHKKKGNLKKQHATHYQHIAILAMTDNRNGWQYTQTCVKCCICRSFSKQSDMWLDRDSTKDSLSKTISSPYDRKRKLQSVANRSTT